MQSGERHWDAFISHASEDKTFVRDLAKALQKQGLQIWLDEYNIKVGDSLRRSIDLGLANSKYGIVVLSPHFFAKEWPQRELDGLAAREVSGQKVILPIWHNITADEVRKYSPTLADRLAVSSEQGLEYVVAQLLRSVKNITTSSLGQKPTLPVQVPIWRIFLLSTLVSVPAALIVVFRFRVDSPIPLSLAILALVVSLGLGYYWRNTPDKERYVLGIGILVTILSLTTAFALRSISNIDAGADLTGTAQVMLQSTNTPTATPTQTPTATPSVTPNQDATEAALMAKIFAAQTAAAPTSTNTPIATNTSAPTETPSPTNTPLPHTPTPSSTPSSTPTNTPLPPTSTHTPTPTPRPGGIFSFSALVNGKYQTHIYNLADSAATPLYIHDDVVDANIRPGDYRLAYRWAESGRGGIWQMDLDGNNQQMLTGFVEDRAPNWSADGSGIFLSSTREGDHSVSRVFRINADGSGGELRMPTVGRDPIEPTGGQLLFSGWLTYDPGSCGIIYYQWRRASGSGEIVGTEGRVSDQCSDYRPDATSNQVVFMRQGDNQSFDIWRNQVGFFVEAAAVNVTPDTPDSNEVLPVFSPDGQWIAFASNRGGMWGIYAVKTNGLSTPALLLEIPASTDFGNWNLSRLSWVK